MLNREKNVNLSTYFEYLNATVTTATVVGCKIPQPVKPPEKNEAVQSRGH
jgi:hypothetical protein